LPLQNELVADTRFRQCFISRINRNDATKILNIRFIFYDMYLRMGNRHITTILFGLAKESYRIALRICVLDVGWAFTPDAFQSSRVVPGYYFKTFLAAASLMGYFLYASYNGNLFSLSGNLLNRTHS